jgi:hypothetical protein
MYRVKKGFSKMSISFQRPSSTIALSLGLVSLATQLSAQEQPRESVAGMKSAQARQAAATTEPYNLRWGPVQFQTETTLRLGLTDNLFRSNRDREEDVLLNPEVTLRARWPVTQINTFTASLGIGYEHYFQNSEVSSDRPLIRPDSELVFNIYTGDFRIQLHERPSYQETLFYNSTGPINNRFYNFTDTGRFSRFDNFLGFVVDWDLHDVLLSLGYDWETFLAQSADFDYLDRFSHFVSPTATFLLGEKTKIGVEAQGSTHDFFKETTLDDHWRARVGPFINFQLRPEINFRLGGGYETAQYDSNAEDSDFQTYYAYGRLAQTTRLFTHAISAGRENLLGDNANNLRNIFVRYNISIPIVRNFDLDARASANFAREFGGGFEEEFDFYRAGLGIGYQFHKYARASLGYDFTTKDSDIPLREYHQNFLTMAVAFKF